MVLNSAASIAETAFEDSPIQSVNLVSEVVSRLRSGIISGELEPLTKLPPAAQMAEQYGVSRTVIREAIRHLRAQDLVGVRRGCLPWVNRSTPEPLSKHSMR